jgi:hypothetical protein
MRDQESEIATRKAAMLWCIPICASRLFLGHETPQLLIPVLENND